MNPLGYFLLGIAATLAVELVICLVVGWRMTRYTSKHPEALHEDWQEVRAAIRRRAEKVGQN